MHRILVFFGILGVFLIPSFTAQSLTDLELGDSESPATIKPVRIANVPLPVEYAEKNVAQELVPAMFLESGETYQSEFFNLVGYSHAAFYVELIKTSILDEPSIRYQLDAFFATDTELTGLRDFAQKRVIYLHPGSQEGGSKKNQHETEKKLYVKTSTGETSTRVLFSPLYCPFVRLEFKNLTPGKAGKFRIRAYLIAKR